MVNEPTQPHRRAPKPGPGRDDRDVHQAIVAATRRLLDDRRFDEISVADILEQAQVSRGSFYFYFASKHEVLAELVRRAVDTGHQAAQPWLSHDDNDEDERRQSLRHGIRQGAQLWSAEAPVLRAVVENWRADPQLTELWLRQMADFTAATEIRIANDSAADTSIDPAALAATLTWLGERLYYLAAVGVAPFDDQDTLVDVLTHIWMSALYGDAGSARQPGATAEG